MIWREAKDGLSPTDSDEILLGRKKEIFHKLFNPFFYLVICITFALIYTGGIKLVDARSERVSSSKMSNFYTLDNRLI